MHGLGVFTERDLRPGEKIARLEGPLIHGAEVSADLDPYPNLVGVAPGSWIDPDPPFDRLNHSCTPNIAIARNRQIYAITSILAGTELLLDYSTTECDALWSMDCSCGSANCRQTLRAIQYSFTTPPRAPPGMVAAWHRLTAG